MSDSNEVLPAKYEEGESIDFPWLRMENEPEIWYNRFMKYYLALGPGRTLLKAMMACYQEEDPQAYELILLNPRQSASTAWSITANTWQWRVRARMYDAVSMKEAIARIDEARAKIIGATPQAADALITALQNPRLAVAAAKEILDRGGLPGTVVHENRVSPFTADELSQAQKEVGEWEQKFLPTPKSDSNG